MIKTRRVLEAGAPLTEAAVRCAGNQDFSTCTNCVPRQQFCLEDLSRQWAANWTWPSGRSSALQLEAVLLPTL